MKLFPFLESIDSCTNCESKKITQVRSYKLTYLAKLILINCYQLNKGISVILSRAKFCGCVSFLSGADSITIVECSNPGLTRIPLLFRNIKIHNTFMWDGIVSSRV